ncbi:twin transmembrane helix small protein [Sphingomonas gilva]|uniref:Twin transmembrane helix small protein n=1 Tax=Sphingomonas gilva TaxID=2305907 RepID=A0A396RRW2_9SPHN|nr:twin transmembrane helix small protein [Sphingomonas gilva]RHW19394.1 twin transmembrane helix small protein [Sphingomonas gilva]
MNTILVIALVLAMIATVVALVRGIIAFLRTTEADLKGVGPSQPGLRSNQMMRARIMFQALAILIVVAILALAGRT